MSQGTSSTITGRVRRRKTSRMVKVKDALARTLITAGGVGTIVAVSTVCVFLVFVVLPLFRAAEVDQRVDVAAPWSADQVPIQIAVDEHRLLGWSLFADGTLRTFRADTGEPIERRELFAGQKITAWSFLADTEDMAFGFADGTVRLGAIKYLNTFLPLEQVPQEFHGLGIDQPVVYDNGVLRLTREGGFRHLKVEVSFQTPLDLPGQGQVDAVAHTVLSNGSIFIVGLTADGTLTYNEAIARRNVLTRQTTYTLAETRLPYVPRADGVKPQYLLISGLGDTVYLAWRDGLMVRFDTRDRSNPRVAEELRLTEPPHAITAMSFLIGRTTLAVGDSSGLLSTWWRARVEGTQTSDGAKLIRGHVLGTGGAPVRSISASMRSRLVVAGHEDGHARLYHVTSDQLLADVTLGTGEPALAVRLAPRDDRLVAAGPSRLRAWDLQLHHPAVTLASVSGKVHYEGYPAPIFKWESSSGTDDFEPKYGLWPLVFGTLKATFYSMLFGLPLALLAAIYTSEFMHPRAKARIKPTIEMMASLPSVVLGFLAALVFSVFVERVVVGVLMAFVTVPLTLLLAGYLWQLLPHGQKLRLERFRFVFILSAIPLGLMAALGPGPLLELIGLDRAAAAVGLGWVLQLPALGRLVEVLLFSGQVPRSDGTLQTVASLRTWLNGNFGSPVGGWLILFIPLSALLTGLVMARFVTPRLRETAGSWSRRRAAVIDVMKFVVGVLFTLGMALLAAWLITRHVQVFGLTLWPGWDARGNIIDTYSQRNALVVGFVMGFAIIPIIYTISEDALSAVPEHLRAAALGAGATRWQTAMRIVLPTAMSGLFSATMIGLGRAVGETMIILMAAGNTALLDINIFNGMRTLASTIAIELAEAPKGGTLYRMLFLAALTLFIMTFVLNTVAEVIRLRFRRRAFEL